MLLVTVIFGNRRIPFSLRPIFVPYAQNPMRSKNLQLTTQLAFVIVCLVWGSTWLAIKIGLSSVPPLLSIVLRFSIAVAVVFPIVRIQKIEIPRTREAKRLYINLIIFAFTIPFALIYWAEQYISSGLTSILFTTYPFWVAIFSQMMLPGEPLNAFKIVGIVLGFVGTTIIFAGDLNLLDRSNMLAMFAVTVCPLMQAYSLVVTKKWGQPIHPFVFNLVGMGGSILPLLAASLLFESYSNVEWNGAAIGSILYLGIIGSVVVFAAYYWLLKRIEAVYLSLVSFVTPIISVILGTVFLHESFERTALVGAAFVLAGILVAHGRYFYRRGSEAIE